MTKASREKLVLKALQFHGPMSDQQLAWWMTHFEIKTATAKKIRRRLTRNGLVRFAQKAYLTQRGQLVCLWELNPNGKKM